MAWSYRARKASLGVAVAFAAAVVFAVAVAFAVVFAVPAVAVVAVGWAGAAAPRAVNRPPSSTGILAQ